jgi:hypothetical protein
MSPDSSNPGVYHAHIHFSRSDDLDTNGVIDIKFRQDSSWLVNWGGNDFPEGQGILNWSNIPLIAVITWLLLIAIRVIMSSCQPAERLALLTIHTI